MRAQNVLLISIDSLRPEALSCYPRHFSLRETFPYSAWTPTLDGLAEDGVLFTTLICQAPFTPASHASFFTGLNPPSHGVRAFFGCELLGQAETIAERLRREGYRTAAFIGADALNSRFGLHRGFDVYDSEFGRKIGVWIQGQYRRLGSEATERALVWLQERKEPLFLFVHYFDAHLIAPHILAEHDFAFRVLRRLGKARLTRGPARRFLLKLETFYSRYQRCGKPFHVKQVRRVDREIARIVQALKDHNLYDRTLIIIMSDHGDAFGEHGEIGHRKCLYDMTLCVPLILKGIPGHKGKIVTTMVRSIDLVPTVYELLGLEPNASEGYKSLEGKSVLPLIEGEESEERVAYAETRMEKSLENPNDLRSHYVALRTPCWKLIVNMLDGSRELYDIANDPAETRNLISQRPDIAKPLFDEAMRVYNRGDDEVALQVSYTQEEQTEIEKRLRDLGYL